MQLNLAYERYILNKLLHKLSSSQIAWRKRASLVELKLQFHLSILKYLYESLFHQLFVDIQKPSNIFVHYCQILLILWIIRLLVGEAKLNSTSFFGFYTWFFWKNKYTKEYLLYWNLLFNLWSKFFFCFIFIWVRFYCVKVK